MLSTITIEFKFSIKVEKDISLPIRLSPTFRIAADISELKYIKNSHINIEQLIKIPNISNLKTNWYGLSIGIPEK